MFKRLKTASVLLTWGALIALPQASLAAETDALSKLLKKVDSLVCSSPKKITKHYTSDMVIISDDRRVLPEHRIQDYEAMIAQLQDMKCDTKRTILTGTAGDKIGFLLVDEMISVSSRLSTDERQHSVCTYAFTKQQGTWKIKHEHCSSLPDYTIVPGDDALYYFHNPVY